MATATTKELKVLVCSGNLGNAEPTQASMEAWIPALGARRGVVNGGDADDDDDGCFFDLISIGMQESTWKKKDGSSSNASAAAAPVDEDDLEEKYQKGLMELTPGAVLTKAGSVYQKGMAELAPSSVLTKAGSVLEVGRDAHDSTALRTMIQRIVGPDYVPLVEQQRGQMRLFVLARKHLGRRFSDVKVKCENTGIGHVLANKGGIVAYLTYQQGTTCLRLCFASAHLAAHEGAAYYAARCDNLREIFWGTAAADPPLSVDATLASHVLFLCGDLNFRTRFPDSDDMDQDARVQKAMELIQAKDWETLYSYDELQQGLRRGDLLSGFQTSPCVFSPTFKVEREAGFVYKAQRTPSYTDRILWKCAGGLEKIVIPESYEPCADFATSDHKPIRGAFSIKPNETVLTVDKLHLVFRGLKCSDLPAMDVDGLSDPYLKFKLVPDHRAEKVSKRSFVTGAQSPAWPATVYVAKTLNPVWTEEIGLTVEGKVGADAMLFVMAYDYDAGTKDDLMGTLALNLQELLRSPSDDNSSSTRTIQMDRPLLKYGKECGRIQFMLEILPFQNPRKAEGKTGVLGRAQKMLGMRKQQK